MIKKRIISGSSTLIDWMDFSVFALLTPLLSRIFFSHHHPKYSYLLSLFIFSSAYVTRPIGGYILGKISMRLSLISTLRISVLTMTLSSFGITLLPTYDQLGYTGAIMLLAIRVIQGIIIGGQTPAAFIVLCEENNFCHPNLIASITSIFTYIGVILGQFLTYILTIVIGSNSMAVWGWRLLFSLIGLVACRSGLV